MKEFIKAVDVVASDLKAGNNAAAVKDFQRLGLLAKQDHSSFEGPRSGRKEAGQGPTRSATSW